MILKTVTTLLACAAIVIALNAAHSIYTMWGVEVEAGRHLNIEYLLQEDPAPSVLDSLD